MKEIEVFYFQRRGAKIIQVWGMNEFLSIAISNDDDEITGVGPMAPAQGYMLV